MTPKTLLILTDDNGWHLGMTDGSSSSIEKVQLPDEPSAEDIAQAIIDHLSQSDNSDAPQNPGGLKNIPGDVVLGVASGWCLCGTVPVPDLPARQRRTAMLFALEEKLPVPVEQVVADFIVGEDSALGIAVETERLRTLIDALEDHGLRIDNVCPIALLGLQHLTTSDQPPESPLVWRERSGLNLFELDPEQRLKHWRWLPGLVDSETTGLDPSKDDLNDSDLAWNNRCLDGDGHRPTVIDKDMAELALQGATSIQAGRTEPLINLRRDALDVSDRFRKIRWQVNAVIAAAAVLLLSLAGTLLWRAHEYQQAEARYDMAISSLFQDTFGDQPQPISVRRRLNTRLRELQGLAGQQFNNEESTEKVSALWLLHDLLERVPDDQRVCLLNIKIEHDYLSLDGQARSHSDADRIAAALRRGGRFEVDPPSTSNLKDGGVSFTLHCTPIDKSNAVPPSDDTQPSSRVVTTGEVLP